ncbi:TetR/AcrR family transcriptional regulator [Kitasatospora sp. HPMI-4]|uniref:TetR/AcrR family transcriptional regulator n=1 Tax=Kitasatospora sp. HPMI-4 TaxID=3448443 RepID=UPI003F1BFE2A
MARPRTPLLDRTKIATAALRLVDESGELTIPGLAAALGVRPSALYHHVDGRAGVIALLREDLCEVIGAGDYWELPWEEALAAWARSYRDAFAAHPGLVPLLATAPLTEPFLHVMYGRAVAVLVQAGFAESATLSVITALESFVLGSALDLVAPSVMIDLVDPVATPHLAGALDALPSRPARADQAFELGLRAQLTGYRALLAP